MSDPPSDPPFDPPFDPQSGPRERDRKRAMAEIDDAYAEGRITAADRTLRMANVESAATLAELDLVVRDLKLGPGEVAPRMVAPEIPVPPPAPPPPPAGHPQAYGTERGPQGVLVASPKVAGTAFRVGCLLLVSLIVLVSVGVSVFVARVDFGDSVDVDNPFPEEQLTQEPSDEPTTPRPPADRLAFTVAGLRWFIGRYEDEFDTTRALRLTLWADRASIDRPVHGGRRHEMWAYSDSVFEQYGSVTTNFPGATVVDLRRLRLRALVANIARAKRTLNVEDPETVYVIVADDSLGNGPEAHIYVSNKYNEGGYLATTFGGKVVRSYPFQR